jgi:hypothetical protein
MDQEGTIPACIRELHSVPQKKLTKPRAGSLRSDDTVPVYKEQGLVKCTQFHGHGAVEHGSRL